MQSTIVCHPNTEAECRALIGEARTYHVPSAHYHAMHEVCQRRGWWYLPYAFKHLLREEALVIKVDGVTWPPSTRYPEEKESQSYFLAVGATKDEWVLYEGIRERTVADRSREESWVSRVGHNVMQPHIHENERKMLILITFLLLRENPKVHVLPHPLHQQEYEVMVPEGHSIEALVEEMLAQYPAKAV